MKKAGIAIGILAVVFLVMLAIPTTICDGVVGRPINVTVRNRTGAIIPNASIMLLLNIDESLERIMKKEDFIAQLKANKRFSITDTKGTGSLLGHFGAGWSNGIFGRSGHFLIDGDLVVSHPDYIELRAPLQNFTQDRKISMNKTTLNITVFLDAKKITEPGAAPNGSPVGLLKGAAIIPPAQSRMLLPQPPRLRLAPFCSHPPVPESRG